MSAKSSGITRRQFFSGAAAGAAGLGLDKALQGATRPGGDGTVRDRFWVFACAANSDYPNIGQRSVMTPVEATFYLGVPNLIVVQSSTGEAPYGRLNPPFEQYAIAMRPLKRVVWSVVGSGGFTSQAETREVLDLVKRMPNFAGIMLDDFFTSKKEGQRAVWTVDHLGDIRQELRASSKDLRIFVTLYTSQLDLPLSDYLNLVDVITLWTGDPAQLERLEENLKKVEKLFPDKKIMQGCYVVDYGKKASVSVTAMQQQCETGLRWLREGRIEGMIFLGNTTMDLGYESVEWTRNWIQKVGDTVL